jgi:addiction module RelE/StbE family toxin
MQILFKKSFQKSYRNLSRKLQHQVDTIVYQFMQDPFDTRLRNHKLKGKRLWCRSIDITGDLRLIFSELSEGSYELVALIDIGTHSQLY